MSDKREHAYHYSDQEDRGY